MTTRLLHKHILSRPFRIHHPSPVTSIGMNGWKLNPQLRCSSRSLHTIRRNQQTSRHENGFMSWTPCNRYGNDTSSKTTYQLWLSVMGGVVLSFGLLYKVKRSPIEAKEDLKVESQDKQKLHVDVEDKDIDQSNRISLQEAIEISRDLVQRIKDESGSPGVSVAVSVDGQTVWSEGLGYSDVENRVPCTADKIFRIASISKPITMAAVARLMEKGDLDIDKPVQDYVPTFPEKTWNGEKGYQKASFCGNRLSKPFTMATVARLMEKGVLDIDKSVQDCAPTFPKKTWNGEKVVITTRQLVSHLGGIRHYDKKYMEGNKESDKKVKQNQTGNAKSQSNNDKQTSQSISVGPRNEYEMEEYYIKKKFKSVTDSLALFKDDPLVHKPGTNFLYTTHGWTLISAVIEGATKTSYESHIKAMLKEMGMNNTYLDENEPLIYNRARPYMKNKKGRLINTPYVDLSYKWAGGGLISSVMDVVKFGNVMLYSYQANGHHGNNSGESENSHLPGFLKPETMKTIFTPVDNRDFTDRIPGGRYAMGWGVWPKQQKHGCCRDQKLFMTHSGGAIGGSSVLLILPSSKEELQTKGDHSVLKSKGDNSELSKGDNSDMDKNLKSVSLPKGVVVAIIANLTQVSFTKTALEIAQVFERVK